MYESSFGLGPAPFRLMPDPRFYLDDGQYGTLLAKLSEGLQAGEPCLLLTGPAGSGKTAAVQRLLTVLDRKRWTVGAMFASADAAGADVLHAVAYAFNLARADMQPGPAFDAWLPREIARGRRVLLVVDEAEHLDEGALRQLAERLAQARGAPGLQLCLVGEQPPASLAGAVRDGLVSAVDVHCRLRALDATETRDYVLHRLRCAGWKGRPAFDRAATDAIHRRSEGIPRRIHLIADRVLLQLSLDAVDVATAADVETADDLRTVELQGRAPVEALPSAGAAPSRAGPNIGAHANPHVEAAPRVESPAPPRRISPDGLRVGSPAAESDRGTSRLPDGAMPGDTPPAGTSGARAEGVLPEQTTAPSWTVADNRKVAAGAIVVALAGIGIGWWLGVGGAVPPPAVPRNVELESARATATAPAGGLAELAGSTSPAAPPAASPVTSPAADPAPLARATPAPALVTAEPGPVAGPPPSSSPSSAEPPPATAEASATDTTPAKGGTGGPSPAQPMRSGHGRAPSVGAARDASPTGGLPRDARRTVAAVPASPTPAPCTRAAAVLGLCEPAAARPPPASPPVRTALPAADVVPPELQPAAAPAAPAAPSAPCEPSRAALGLCER